ncbi:hypothetical protein AUJ29_01425 [Candidatus Kuenenbacteria bacterium CG1_02_38_13]|nr:MAG: hypothetical protein AUJ29_01425 [Candidatus Kuenenbacteria bacterium CG1_02_38_13]
MKIVIFAGGIGTRLWPLSRKNSPKQFYKIFDGKSTLELAFERLRNFGVENIYAQTIQKFSSIIAQQLPDLPCENIFIEPAMRNVGPAVALAAQKLKALDYSGPIAIIWADHIMKRPEEFTEKLEIAERLIEKNFNRFIFLAEQPRFANNNLGWIRIGSRIGETDCVDLFEFKGWKYKPDQVKCNQMFKSGEYFWNPGYFVSSIDFILSQYKKLAPRIFTATLAVARSKDSRKSADIYSNLEKESFDRCLIEKTDFKDAIVLKTDMGWSDPGTLYALKEALQKSFEENVEIGKVFNYSSKDSLIYNLENKKLVATVGLDGMIVVNTENAIIVTRKDKVKEITGLVEQLERFGYGEYL